MPVLQPFRALFGPERLLFIPGEDDPPGVDEALLKHDSEPAMFLYHQHCGGGVREGVMGLLNRAAARVYPHEETEAARVARCRMEKIETGSVFVWTSGVQLPKPCGGALIDVYDRFGCRHQIWRVAEPERIAEMQEALAGRRLFLADGHHRFAAGWQLATIQVRTPALQSLAAHRLVLGGEVALPEMQPAGVLEDYWARTPAGCARFGVVLRNEPLLGMELPLLRGERSLSALHRQCLSHARVQPVRGCEAAIDAVQCGAAEMAFLVEPVSVDHIEADAARGLLLPPKSTDFFPKLAGGLVMRRRNQNDTFAPPIT